MNGKIKGNLPLEIAGETFRPTYTVYFEFEYSAESDLTADEVESKIQSNFTPDLYRFYKDGVPFEDFSVVPEKLNEYMLESQTSVLKLYDINLISLVVKSLSIEDADKLEYEKFAGGPPSPSAYANPLPDFSKMETVSKPVIDSTPVVPVAATPVISWVCSCGTQCNSNFCCNCGKAKPVIWKCSCGAENEGNFCTKCGLPKAWTCKCGETNTGKFCTGCGLAKQ